jgi:hypothetical protein
MDYNYDLRIKATSHFGSNCNIVLDPAGQVDVNTPISVHGDVELVGPSRRLVFGERSSSQAWIGDGGTANDIQLKMSGGDFKMYRINTPNAGNWETDLYIEPTYSLLGLYGGYSRGYSGQVLEIGNGKICGSVNYTTCSDDRLKSEESDIVDATNTLMKLKPQTYMKGQRMGTESPDVRPKNYDATGPDVKALEAGLIAQEVYYDAPELRFIVKSNQDMEQIKELPENIVPQDVNDKEWLEYGWSPDYASSVSYTELIPYLIKMNQEQQSVIESLSDSVSKLQLQFSQVASQTR